MASSGASKVPHATDIESALVEIVPDAAQRLKAQRSLASWGKQNKEEDVKLYLHLKAVSGGRVSKKNFTEAKEKITQRRKVTYDFWVVPMAEAETALKTHTDLEAHVVTAEEMNLLQQSVVGPEDVMFEGHVIFAANTPFWKLPKSAFKFPVAMTSTRGAATA